jgi:hypothetical protein
MSSRGPLPLLRSTMELAKPGAIHIRVPRLSRGQRSALACLALAGLSTMVCFFVFVPTASLLALFSQPFLTLRTVPAGGTSAVLRFLFGFGAWGILYWQGWRAAKQAQGKMGWAAVIAGSVLPGTALLFLYPVGAADIFDYIMRGRILGLYGANPFLRTPADFSHDLFFSYAAWRSSPSAYGPAWEVMASFVARLTGNGVVANVLGFKLLAGSFLLLSLGIVALVLRREAPDRALGATLLLGWNPIVLYETCGNGHNDVIMVFWLLLAAWALLRQRFTLMVLALVAGALFKFIPALLLPAALLSGMGRLTGVRARFGYLARTSLASVLLAICAYAPFWGGVGTLGILRRTQLYSSSIPASAYYLLEPRLGQIAADRDVGIGAVAVTALIAVWMATRAWGERAWTRQVEIWCQILTFYLLATCLWFQNWYALWPIGLTPFLPPGASRRLAIVLGFAALSKPLVAGPLLFWPTPRLPQPQLEAAFTAGVLGLPWACALVLLWRSRARLRPLGAGVGPGSVHTPLPPSGSIPSVEESE